MTAPNNPLIYIPQKLQSDRLKYPGLLAEETIVLRAWLKTNEALFDRFDYNLRVGPPHVSQTPLTPEVQRCADLIHQARIDAVGWRGVDASMLPPLPETPSEIYSLFPAALATIIEVKRRVINDHVGKILSYRDNWMSENTQCHPPDLLFVCATYSPIILASLVANNMQLNTVSVNFSMLRLRPRP